MKILILTGDQRRHRYFVHHLAHQHTVVGVVVEPVYVPTVPAGPEGEIVRRHFSERDSVEREFFGGFDWHVPENDRLTVPKGDVNSSLVVDWVSAREPAYLVVYGSSIIGEPLLRRYENRCVNLHLGLAPYYRGSATNFWPLVNREPELVGATIHFANARVDGGPILGQIRPAIQESDRSHQIGCRAIESGTAAMIAVLNNLRSDDVKSVQQTPGGRQYKRRDFNADAVMTMWQQFDTGMIPEYLRAPERAERYPIVSVHTS